MTLKATALLLTCVAVPASALNLGDLVDDVKKNGTEVLQQTKSNSSTTGSSNNALSSATVTDGLKEALSVGTERAIKMISAKDGFLKDQAIKIPMPGVLSQLAGPMRQLGLGDQVDAFETSINRAAEKAAPKAAGIIGESIKSMTFEDASRIYQGADDAATEYFKEKTSSRIAELFKPDIEQALGEVGATRYYSQLAQQAAAVPVVGKEVNTDLTDYVTQAALAGLFTKLAEQEKSIRENPAARTTELLKQLWDK